MAPIDTSWDGVVIGAGPAGAMAARELALAGRRILLVEKKQFPALEDLWRLLERPGTRGPALGGLGIAGETARERSGWMNSRSVSGTATARVALPEGAALSRSRLDAALVEAATDAGAQFLQETQAIVGGIRDGTAAGATHTTRAVDRGSRRGSCWSPPAWEIQRQAGGSAARPRFGPARGSARVAWSTMPRVSTQERTIFMAVGERDMSGWYGLRTAA